MEINPIYKNDQAQKEIALQFQKQKEEKFPAITLCDFFTKTIFNYLEKEFLSLDYQKKIEPLSHSFSQGIVSQKIHDFFHQKDFLNFLSLILGKRVKAISLDAKALSWKDYTLINDEKKEKGEFDLLFSFSDWNVDFGGSIFYVDGSFDFAQIYPQKNSLTLVQRKENVQRYLKYVNSLAQEKKLFLLVGIV